MPSQERQVQIKKKCEELAEIAARKIGASAWYDHASKVLTAEETHEVEDLWATMSGSSSWMSAFFVWFNGY